jgi:hypothetical protein
MLVVSNWRMIVNNELQRTQKEAVVVNCKVLSRHFLNELTKITKNNSQGSQPPMAGVQNRSRTAPDDTRQKSWCHFKGLTNKQHGAESYLEADSGPAGQEIRHLLWNPKFHNSPPLKPILSQMNPSTPSSYLFRSCFIIIFPSTPRSPKSSFPLTFSD